jgi:hypothetical protein
VLLASLLLAAVLPAGAQPALSLNDYDLRAERAPSRQVVHYLKSNLDGSQRVVVSQYFPAPFQVEALKVEADGRYLALVKAQLDPRTLTEARIESFNGLENGGAGRLQMRLHSDEGQQRLVAEVAGTRMPVQPSRLPAHVYNFDLAGLNLTLPMLKNPRADFAVGLVDPDFEFLRTRFKPNAGELPGGMIDRGTASFRYLRDEKLDGDVDTHRFEVGGPAFGGVTGSLWVNAKDRLIQRFEHAQPDNPAWKSLRLNRMASRSMDAAGWAAFTAATVRRAQDLGEPGAP